MSDVDKRRAIRKAGAHGNSHPERTMIVAVLLFTAFCSAVAFGAVDAIAIGTLAIAAAVILLLWVADAWRAGHFAVNVDSLCLPIAGLILIGCVQLLPLGGDKAAQDLVGLRLSSALSLDPYATRMFIVRLAILLVFFAAAFTFIDTKKKIVNCAIAVIVFSAALAFFGILQRLSGTEYIYGLRRPAQAIFFGPFINQHHFAAFMELASGLALGILLGRGVNREQRIFLSIAAVVMGIGVVFTGSRGGILSYIGVITIAALLSFLKLQDSDRGESRVGRMATLAGGAALLIGVVLAGFFLGGGEALFRGLGSDQSDITSGRTHFWSVAWKIFLDHPIIGAGHEAFAVAFTRYDTWHGAFRIEQAHNDYLQMLADAGVLGLACVAAFIYLLAKKSLNVIAGSADDLRTSIAIGALSGCAGIIIHSVVDFPLRTMSNAIFFLLLVVFACAWVEKDRKGSGRSRRRSRSKRETISEL